MRPLFRLRSNSIFLKHLQKHSSMCSIQYLQWKSFCAESDVKEISLDDLLSSALMDDVPRTEQSESHKTKNENQPEIIQQLGENDFDEEEIENMDANNRDDETGDVREEDDNIDDIIDEIESGDALIPSNKLQKYDKYLPAMSESMSHETFRSMGLRKKLERNLCSVHGLSPLPIQALSFDKINSFQLQYSISASIIESRMGSGKTLAYLLPIMNDLNPLHCGQVVIVAPTNELGIQIKSMLKSYLINHEDYKHNHRTSSYLANNQDKKRTKQQLLGHCVMNCNSNESLDYNIDYIQKVRPSVIIGTPKRIRELFLYSILKPSKINYIVFDEVDSLFPVKSKNDKHRHKNKINHSHLKPAQLILNGIIKQQNNASGDGHKCHALFVGATISNQLKSFIHQMLQPYPVQLISTYNDNLLTSNEKDTNDQKLTSNTSQPLISPNIQHQYVCVEKGSDKALIISELITMIRSNPKNKKAFNPAVLIFVNKESSPIKFAEALCEHDLKCALLHEYINDKALRNKFLKLFRSGSIDAVIATESICRGLDFIWLDHIIVAEMPSLDTSYLHMSGRCSRLESKGFVTSIVDEYEEDRLQRYCFKYQIELTELDSKLKLEDLIKQRRKYDKLNTFPLLLQNKEYQKKLKQQLYLANNQDNRTKAKEGCL